MAKITCCGKELQLKRSKEGIWWTQCTCGRRGKGATEDQAELEFRRSSPTMPAIPERPAQLAEWSSNHFDMLHAASAAFIDKPATARLIANNVSFIARQSGKEWDRVWSTPEGRESVVLALQDSFKYGASLPGMGSLVPYNGIIEFIPDVSAYRFAMTTGKNAPFIDTFLDVIYESDKDSIKCNQKNGEFYFELGDIKLPRGEPVGVAVYGHLAEGGMMIGRIYDESELEGKARASSSAYKTYLDDLRAFEYAKSEGKTEIENGKEYAERIMYKKGGKDTWPKKVFIDDLKNPWVGANKADMMRKTAGKNFFKDYMKSRDSREMAVEMASVDAEKEDKKDIGNIIDTAFVMSRKQFAEPEPEPAPKKTKVKKPEIAPKNEVEVIEQTGVEAEYIPLVEEPAGKPEQAEILVDKI